MKIKVVAHYMDTAYWIIEYSVNSKKTKPKQKKQGKHKQAA